jgi:hypothetical protein
MRKDFARRISHPAISKQRTAINIFNTYDCGHFTPYKTQSSHGVA